MRIHGFVLAGVLCSLVRCTTEAPSPPLPDEPVILEDVVWTPARTESAEMIELPERQCDYQHLRTSRQKRRGPVPVTPVTPVTTEIALAPASITRPVKPVRPEQVIAQGLKDAEVSPTPDCYEGNGAICHFVFEPGKLYTIPTHPSAATRLYFPPGDRVVTAPLINLCKEDEAAKGQCWEQISGRKGPDGAQQDILAFRPVTADTPAVITGVDLESGDSIYFRLVVGKTPMLGVTWDMPRTRRLDGPPQVRFASHPAVQEGGGPPPCAGTGMRMPIELAQLHTAYKIEPKGPVGFLPTQVFDDGRKTLLKFRQLGGNMPLVFVYKPSGERALVYFTPYRVPGDPSSGVWYVIDQIWATIELTGTDGQSVLITRLSDVPTVARADAQRR